MKLTYVESEYRRVQDNDIPPRARDADGTSRIFKWEGGILDGLDVFKDARVCFKLNIGNLISSAGGACDGKTALNASVGGFNIGTYSLIDLFEYDVENQDIQADFWFKEHGQGMTEADVAGKWIYFMDGLFKREWRQAAIGKKAKNSDWTLLMQAILHKKEYDSGDFTHKSGRDQRDIAESRLKQASLFLQLYYGEPFSYWADSYGPSGSKVICSGFCPESMRQEVDTAKKILLDRIFTFRLPSLDQTGNEQPPVAKIYPYDGNESFLEWASAETGAKPGWIRIRMR